MKEKRSKHRAGEIDLGLRDERVPLGDHSETHPLTFCGNVLRENPFYVGVDEFLERLKEA